MEPGNLFDALAGQHRDFPLRPEGRRPDQDTLETLLAREIILAERRPFVGDFRLLADIGVRAFELTLPQRDRGLRAAMTSANDQDVKSLHRSFPELQSSGRRWRARCASAESF